MSAPELDAATIAEWTRRGREAAGLPARITDPVVLAKVITLALGPGPAATKAPRPARERATVNGP